MIVIVDGKEYVITKNYQCQSDVCTTDVWELSSYIRSSSYKLEKNVMGNYLFNNSEYIYGGGNRVMFLSQDETEQKYSVERKYSDIAGCRVVVNASHFCRNYKLFAHVENIEGAKNLADHFDEDRNPFLQYIEGVPFWVVSTGESYA